MPLVGRVGSKRPRARLAMFVVYALLTLGALTTLYPFLTMATTAFKGPTDQNDNRLVPLFWSDEGELLTKFRDDKYAGDLSLMAAMDVGGDQGRTSVDRYREFLEGLEVTQWTAGFKTPSNHVTSRLNREWQEFLKGKYDSVEEVNEAFNEINGAFQQVTPPPERLDDPKWLPKEDQKWRDWVEFKEQLPVEFRIPLTGKRLWQEWLRTQTKNQVEEVPGVLRAGAGSFEEIPLARNVVLEGDFGGDLGRNGESHPMWVEFMASGVPEVFRESGLIEDQWRMAGNRRELPIATDEAAFVKVNESTLRNEFTWRNYFYIFDFVVINGKALSNTVIFCLLAIGTQLTVNPLAAYALSRYPMKWTGQILVFLLATMAFPAEVTMIPAFLLLKDVGLLNTFAALVLPAAASGFMIFLLKGFFDSLPGEVFDSGQIDGAPEWVMMLKIAFPLSKPVFGYLALLAFMGAYGAFLYAFLVAQDREMWTLMVFIYQLQQIAPKPVIMAATTIAAIPTLLVFLAAQNVIMRGIVLPGER